MWREFIQVCLMLCNAALHVRTRAISRNFASLSRSLFLEAPAISTPNLASRKTFPSFGHDVNLRCHERATSLHCHERATSLHCRTRRPGALVAGGPRGGVTPDGCLRGIPRRPRERKFSLMPEAVRSMEARPELAQGTLEEQGDELLALRCDAEAGFWPLLDEAPVCFGPTYPRLRAPGMDPSRAAVTVEDRRHEGCHNPARWRDAH